MRRFLSRSIVIPAVALIIGIAIGAAGGVDDGIAAANATPQVVQASPRIVLVTPEPTPESTPAPMPTPQEVTPLACLDAVAGMSEEIVFLNDIVNDVVKAYVDFPEEDLGAFGFRVETILNGIDPDELGRLTDESLASSGACLDS